MRNKSPGEKTTGKGNADDDGRRPSERRPGIGRNPAESVCGTIMAIMEAMAFPRGDYYDFQVKNGSGYILNHDGTYTAIG